MNCKMKKSKYDKSDFEWLNENIESFYNNYYKKNSKEFDEEKVIDFNLKYIYIKFKIVIIPLISFKFNI